MSDDWTKRCAREWHPHQRGEAEALAAHIRRHARQQCPHCYTTLFNAESDSESPEAVRPGAGCPTPPEPESLEAVVEREFVDIFTDYYQDSNKTFKPQAVMMARRLSEKLRPWLTARDLKQLEGQADYIRNLERERDALLKLVEDRARAIDKVCIERDEARETAKSLHGECDDLRSKLTDAEDAEEHLRGKVGALREALEPFATAVNPGKSDEVALIVHRVWIERARRALEGE